VAEGQTIFRPATFAFHLGGDSYKRPPQDVDAEHPLIDDLKRKSFIGMAELTQRQRRGSNHAIARSHGSCRASRNTSTAIHSDLRRE